jgi:hypothetical protein
MLANIPELNVLDAGGLSVRQDGESIFSPTRRIVAMPVNNSSSRPPIEMEMFFPLASYPRG